MLPQELCRRGAMAVMVSWRPSGPLEVSPAGSVHDGPPAAGAAGGGGGGLQRDRGRGDAAALPDGAAGPPGRDRPRDRAADAAPAADRDAGPAPVRGGRRGGRAVPGAAGRAPDGDRGLAGRAAAGHRPGSAPRRGRQHDLDDAPAGRLPGRRHRAGRQPGDGAAPPARGRIRRQAADLDDKAQGGGAGRVPGKRARVEALLAMASPAPPPVADLLADLATLVDVPPDLPTLLARLPRADLYLQDEVQAALHPTLTRLWSPRGRRGQRQVEAPGRNAKVTGFGALDWRDGFFHGLTAPRRPAPPLLPPLGALVAPPRARGRPALVLLGNPSPPPPAGPNPVRPVPPQHPAQ